MTWAARWRTCAGRRSAGPVSDQCSAGRSRRCWLGTSIALEVTDRETLTWWRAAGLLQVALRRYRRLEVSQWKLVPELVGAASDLLACPPPSTSPSTPPAAEPVPTDLLDVRQMTRVLRPALAARTGGTHPVEVETAVELEAAHGGRSVVGYTVRGLDGPRSTYLVAKRFDEQRRARLLHDHLDLLGSGPFASGRLRVPAVVAFLPATRDGRLPAWRGHAAAPEPVARGHHERRPPRGAVAGTPAHLRRPPAPHALPRPGGAEHPRVGGAHRRTAPRPGRPRPRARRRLGSRCPRGAARARGADPQGPPSRARPRR